MFTVVTVPKPFGRTEVRLGYGQVLCPPPPSPLRWTQILPGMGQERFVLLPITHLVMMGKAPGWSVLPIDSCLVPCPQRAAAWSESRAGGAEVRKQCPGPRLSCSHHSAHTASSCPPLYLCHLLSLLGPLLLVFTAPYVPCLPRICYSDTSCPQEDQYPPNIAVKVNHSYCSVPVSQPTGAGGRVTWTQGKDGSWWG